MKKEYQRDCLINDGVTEEQLAIGNEQVLFTAILCHEVTRAYHQSVGDDRMQPWDDAPKQHKNAAVEIVHFHLTRPDAEPVTTLTEVQRSTYFLCRAIVHTMLGGGEVAKEPAEQWAEEERAEMKGANHPALSFNLIGGGGEA